MRRISQYLSKPLLEIAEQAVQLKGLNAKLQALLHEPLRDHCQIGSFNKGCLVITTTDAAWATQLRYEIPRLRDELRAKAGLYKLLSIQIKVVDKPVNQVVPTQPKPSRPLSAAAKAALLQLRELVD